MNCSGGSSAMGVIDEREPASMGPEVGVALRLELWGEERFTPEKVRFGRGGGGMYEEGIFRCWLGGKLYEAFRRISAGECCSY